MNHIVWKDNGIERHAIKMTPVTNAAMLVDALNEIYNIDRSPTAIVTCPTGLEDIKNLFADKIVSASAGTFLKLKGECAKLERDDRCKEVVYIIYVKRDPVIYEPLGDELP